LAKDPSNGWIFQQAWQRTPARLIAPGLENVDFIKVPLD
jgi:hypothetical protein